MAVAFVAGCGTEPEGGAVGAADSLAVQVASDAESTPEDGPEALFLPPGEGRTYGEGGDPIVFKLGDGELGADFEFSETEVSPGNGPPVHIRHETDEAFYVASGTFRVQVGDRSEEVGAGAFGYAPRGVAHAFANTGGQSGTLPVVTAPSNVEAYMREAIPALHQSPPDQEALAALAETYGVEIVGPPLIEPTP